MPIDVRSGDCLDVMAGLDAESVDSVVTDPPYGMSFMGKDWDTFGRKRNYKPRDPAKPRKDGILPGYGRGGLQENVLAYRKRANAELYAFSLRWATAALRVARPGSYLLAFGGTRTWHRLACAIEDAGWEIRDTLCWLYGQGFPKGKRCLKPAWEPIIVARKVGTGDLQIEACRIPAGDGVPKFTKRGGRKVSCFSGGLNGSNRTGEIDTTTGRWPANVILDEEAAGMMDEEVGQLQRRGNVGPSISTAGGVVTDFDFGPRDCGARFPSDSGGPSRFFYCAKASRSEREAGLRDGGVGALRDGGVGALRDGSRSRKVWNSHPTVKPLSLMHWLVRLVTPPGGTVLDPFAGSGTTGCAATLEGFSFIGIEKEVEYVRIAEARIAYWATQGKEA